MNGLYALGKGMGQVLHGRWEREDVKRKKEKVKRGKTQSAKCIALSLFILLFFNSIIDAQIAVTQRDFKVYRGGKVTLQTDAISGRLDTMTCRFVVKEARIDSFPRLIQKISTDTTQLKGVYSSGRQRTTLYIYIDREDTWNITAKKYYYDIIAMNPNDTLDAYFVQQGYFEILPGVQAPNDGTALPGSDERYLPVLASNFDDGEFIYQSGGLFYGDSILTAQQADSLIALADSLRQAYQTLIDNFDASKIAWTDTVSVIETKHRVDSLNNAIITRLNNLEDDSTAWNTAYTDRLKWDGGSTGLNAVNGRSNLDVYSKSETRGVIGDSGAVYQSNWKSDISDTAALKVNESDTTGTSDINYMTWYRFLSNLKTINSNNLYGSGDISIATLIGYTPENSANKVTSLSGASTDTQYTSAKLVYDQLALKAPLASPTFTTTIKLDGTTNAFRVSGGQWQFTNNSGSTWDAIPTSLTGSASGWTLSGANKIYLTTLGNKVFLRRALGDTTRTSRLNIYGTATIDSLYGSESSGGGLFLSSSKHATKGKIYLGANSVYDEVNSRFGIGTVAPPKKLSIMDTQGGIFFDGTDTTYNRFKSVDETADFSIGKDLLFSTQNAGTNPDLYIKNSGNVGIGTTDLDGTPAIGRMTIKAANNNGTSNIIVGRNSTEENKFRVDNKGNQYMSGGIYYKAVADSDGYVPGYADQIIYLDETSGGGDIFLLAGINGLTYTIKKIDSSANTITLYPDGTDDIEFTTDYTITGTQGKFVTINYFNGHWYVIGTN